MRNEMLASAEWRNGNERYTSPHAQQAFEATVPQGACLLGSLQAQCNVCKGSIAKIQTSIISTQPRHWTSFKRKVEGMILVTIEDQDAQSAGLGNSVPKSLGEKVEVPSWSDTKALLPNSLSSSLTLMGMI